MTNIINTNPTELLENFQTAYYQQIGKRMQIGSEEYTLSSIFTYVLSMYSALINSSYKNQLISTASGEFLDNIAQRYGLSRTPEVYSNPFFEGKFIFKTGSEVYGRDYPANSFELIIGNHIYKNSNGFTAKTNRLIRFTCTETHTDYMTSSEILDELKKYKDSNGNLVFMSNTMTNSDITDLLSVAQPLNDDEFRKYINESKYLYTPGIAGSFEALAKSAFGKNINDARVRIQGDAGFVPGFVDIFCKPFSYFNNREFIDIVKELDIPELPNIIKQKGLAVIGQTVRVYPASEIVDSRSYSFYVPKLYNSNEYKLLYKMKFMACCGYLQNKIKVGEAFSPMTLAMLIMKPLSEVFTSAEDCGFTSDDEVYKSYDKYKDLPVIGLKAIDDATILPASPSSYIRISPSNAVTFDFI